MPGSMKGEKRGAAARARRRTVPHETPEEVTAAVRKDQRKGKRVAKKYIERRYEIARIIHGDTGLAADMRPKEMMLDNAQYFHQCALDWQRMMIHYAGIIPPTKESTALTRIAEENVDKYRMLSMDCNYRAGSFHDPKLLALKTFHGDANANQNSIVRDLLDDIDERARNARLINPPVKKVG